MKEESEVKKMNEVELQAARDARNRYAREWRARNKNRVRDANLRYWIRRAAREEENLVVEEEKKDGVDEEVEG